MDEIYSLALKYRQKYNLSLEEGNEETRRAIEYHDAIHWLLNVPPGSDSDELDENETLVMAAHRVLASEPIDEDLDLKEAYCKNKARIDMLDKYLFRACIWV